MESSVFIPSLRFLVASNALATGPLNIAGSPSTLSGNVVARQLANRVLVRIQSRAPVARVRSSLLW